MSSTLVAQIGDLSEGEPTRVVVNGEPIAIFKISTGFFATHDTCTHAQASLSEGYVDGECVECPLHEGVFHIPTGKAISGPVCENLKTYPVKIEDTNVFVEV